MGGKPSKHSKRGLSSSCEKGVMKEQSPKVIVYEKEMMAFAFKKAEWKQEKKKLKEEVKMLKTLVDEKEDKIREMEQQEGGLYWRAEEEDIAEELKREVQAKEETIKELKSKLVSMEQEMYKRDREVDILRQSLRIMTSKKVVQTNKKNLPKKKTLVIQGGKL
uniref:Uncharacterized protein n=1 Tax=Cannabis sativa TaxID=3483 RepID=A0A803Q4D3_CANSA